MNGAKFGGGGYGKFKGKGGKTKCFTCGKSGHWSQQVCVCVRGCSCVRACVSRALRECFAVRV